MAQQLAEHDTHGYSPVVSIPYNIQGILQDGMMRGADIQL